MTVQVGDRLARYDVTALIGTGRVEVVYRAVDTRLDRSTAYCEGETLRSRIDRGVV